MVSGWFCNRLPKRHSVNLHLVIGFVSDKDIHRIFQYMPLKANYYFVRLSVPRTMDETVLASLAHANGYKGQAYSGIKDAFDAVKNAAGKNDLVIITGSNFLVADFLSMRDE